MTVFLSWSGQKSMELASAFDKWIQSVLQAVRPFYSPQDVEKGSFWFQDIHTNLQEASVGILFVTPDNKEKPWLLFEAGALSAKMGKPRVIPLLFELQPADLVGPLPALNAATFTKEDVAKVIEAINDKLDERGLPPEVLRQVFEKWWPDLEKEVSAILAKPSEKARPKRDTGDMLQELLYLARNTEERVSSLELHIEGPSRKSKFAASLRQLPPSNLPDLLERLPSKYREALTYKLINDLSNREIGSIMRISNVSETLKIGERLLEDMYLDGTFTFREITRNT